VLIGLHGGLKGGRQLDKLLKQHGVPLERQLKLTVPSGQFCVNPV
jgi:hypothetical protein